MKDRRLKPREYICMSEEEKLAWRRHLQKRWRHNHPEWVQTSNKKWGTLYKEIKPYTCVCTKCGCEFRAARPYYKRCTDCIQKGHEGRIQFKQLKIQRKQQRKNTLDMIIEMRNSGMTQQEIANKLNRTQSGISALLRRHKDYCEKQKKTIDKTKNK